MHLFLIRHAPAVPRAISVDDAARPLTPGGRRRWKREVAGLDRLGISFDRLVHSPWKRAIETAEIAAPLVRGPTVKSSRLVEPAGPALLEEAEGERVAMIGHEPWMSELVALLLLGSIDRAPRFELKKGGVAWLEGTPRPGEMVLRAMLPPRVLRAIG